MILRRFIKHVRNENWFAVSLDFMVVVIGIFIGMQVTEWNSDRKDRHLEDIYLERLARDIQDDFRVYTLLVEQSTRRDEQINYIENLLNDTNTEPLDATYFMRAVDALGTSRMYGPGQTTWNELVSTGRIQLISNYRVKERLAEYYEHFVRYHSDAHYVEDIQIRVWRLKERWLTTDQVRRTYASDVSEFTLEEAEVVLAAMRADSDFKNLLSSLAMIDGDYRKYASRDLERMSSILNELESEGVDVSSISSIR